MFLSLTLIAERIHLPPDMIMVHDSSRRKYQDIMFYPEFPEQLSQPFSPDILYLSSGFPPSLPAGMQLPDFICIVKPEEFQQAESSVKQLPCSCLLLGTSLSMEGIFNEIHSRILFLRKQIDIFKMALYTQQSLQKLIEMIFDIMGNPAYLVDSSFKVLAIDRSHDMRDLSAAWRRLEDEGYLPFDLVSSLINSKELSAMEAEERAVVVNSRYFYVPFINYNLKQYGKIKGHLFIAGMKKSICQSDIELAEYLGGYVLQLLLRSTRFQNERGDYYEHFMRDLFSGKLTNPKPIRQQMLSLGALPEEFFTVAVLHTSSEHGLSDERIASQMERCGGAKSVFYQDKIATLFNYRKQPDAQSLHSALKRISTELNCEIGVSDTFQGFYDLHTYYMQAEWALTCPASIRLKESCPMIRYYRDYAVHHILYVFSKNEKWKLTAFPELLALKKYDQDNHTELLKTLYSYLIHERSTGITAQELHIHRNTLAYRMERISEICGFPLDNPAVRQRLILSLKAMELFDTEELSSFPAD